MRYNPHSFELQIADNGKGFNVQQQEGNILGGIGLRNMQNRSTLIGAGFKIYSGSETGTAVNIMLPVTDAV